MTNDNVIAKNVVFVQDEDGNNYYIPKDKISDWEYYVDEDYFNKEYGYTPDYATPVEGENFVVDIKEIL